MTAREKEWIRRKAKALAADAVKAKACGNQREKLIDYAQAECLAWVLFELTGENMGDLFPGDFFTI